MGMGGGSPSNGDNNHGQLGLGNENAKSSPEEVKGKKYVSVAAGYAHTLAIDEAGYLWAWGLNNYGQLGKGHTTKSSIPLEVKAGTKFIAIAAGGVDDGFSLAIDSNGSLWAWGRNAYGQLGDGTTTNRTSPVIIMPTIKFKAVMAGAQHSLALASNGDLYAWGRNNYYQLGVNDGTTTDKTSPVLIKQNIVSISAVYYHSLAIDTSGNLWVWGLNNYSQLGDGSTTNLRIPTQIRTGNLISGGATVNVPKFKTISGGSDHTLAIDVEGNLWAWGSNENGCLGYGSLSSTPKNRPLKLDTNVSFTAVNAFSQSIAICEDGRVWTWGRGRHYRLGQGNSNDLPVPTPISSIP